MKTTSYFRFAKEFLAAEQRVDVDIVSDEEARGLARRWRRQWIIEIVILVLYSAAALWNRYLADFLFFLVATIVPYGCFLAMRASENLYLRPGWMLKMKRVMAVRWRIPIEEVSDSDVAHYTRQDWKEMLFVSVTISLIYVSVSLFKRHLAFDLIALLLLLTIGSGAQLLLMPSRPRGQKV
jgi:hypothetical protein